jgi:hypothetical protein
MCWRPRKRSYQCTGSLGGWQAWAETEQRAQFWDCCVEGACSSTRLSRQGEVKERISRIEVTHTLWGPIYHLLPDVWPRTYHLFVKHNRSWSICPALHSLANVWQPFTLLGKKTDNQMARIRGQVPAKFHPHLSSFAEWFLEAKIYLSEVPTMLGLVWPSRAPWFLL